MKTIASPEVLVNFPLGERDAGEHGIKVFLMTVLQTFVGTSFVFLSWSKRPENHLRNLLWLIIWEKKSF